MGRRQSTGLGGNFKEYYADEYTQEKLPDDLSQQAMLDEMEYVCRVV